ncbi:MAG: tetratricopeptide repeat protein [Phycisphaerales bacterium]
MHAGRNDAAAATLLELVRREPKNLHAVNLLASALLLSGKLDQALYYAERAVELAPNLAAVYGTLGNCLTAQGKYEAAHAAFEKAWNMGMREAGIAESMLYCLRQLAKWASGAKFGKLAMDTLPNAPVVAVVTSECLRQLGRSEEALALIEPVVRAFPQHYEARLAYATLLNYVDGRAKDLLEAHCALAQLLPEHRVKVGLPTTNKKQSSSPQLPPKRVGVKRIGLVSGDFRRHSCAWFVLPLLRQAQDSGSLEFVLYSNEPTQDDITEQCRSLAVGWRDVWTWSDAKLVEQVKSDGVDVLVDLAGHTPGNRLRAFSMRAAPLQATWLGYPATTGVKEIDIRIVDWMTDPSADAQSVNIERLIRLGQEKDESHQPLFCFEPPSDLPPVGEGGAGGVVFCCFNSLQKYSEATLKSWAEILRRVPDATLVIKSQGTNVEEVRADLEARLRDAGLAMDRVKIIGYAPTNQSHLAMYQTCDIQLDTFPYNGATTTCESLAMGVPVLTRCGDTHASRVGASIMTAVYGEAASAFIARSDEEYVGKVVGLAGRVGELRKQRPALRQQVLNSNLCNPTAFTQAFAQALRD